jgi:hypothetical protein
MQGYYPIYNYYIDTFGENETLLTEFKCPYNVYTHKPVLISQKLTVLSAEAEAKILLYGLN